MKNLKALNRSTLAIYALFYDEVTDEKAKIQ